jgi:hypothetical protein
MDLQHRNYKSLTKLHTCNITVLRHMSHIKSQSNSFDCWLTEFWSTMTDSILVLIHSVLLHRALLYSHSLDSHSSLHSSVLLPLLALEFGSLYRHGTDYASQKTCLGSNLRRTLPPLLLLLLCDVTAHVWTCLTHVLPSNSPWAKHRKHCSCIAGRVHVADVAQQWVDMSHYIIYINI